MPRKAKQVVEEPEGSESESESESEGVVMESEGVRRKKKRFTVREM